MKTYIAHYEPLKERRKTFSEALAATHLKKCEWITAEPTSNFLSLYSSSPAVWDYRNSLLNYSDNVPFKKLSRAELSLLFKHYLILEQIAAIDDAHNQLETLGGAFEVIAAGVPVGLGSHVQWDRRLEARLGHALLSLQAQKGVEIGPAAWCAAQPGSKAHDPILRTAKERFTRPSNKAGGTEGGMTYGATDEYGYKAVDKKLQIHDLHATMLHLLGMDHKKLTLRFSSRDMRLTDVHGEVIKDILS